MRKKSFLLSWFLILFLLNSTLIFGLVNPDDEDDDDCEENPECCEDGDSNDASGGGGGGSSGCGGTPCNESFSMEIFVGTAPHESELQGGMLRIKRNQPSSAIYSPQALVFHDALETFVTNIDLSDRHVRIVRYNGKGVTYEFSTGSSVGVPVGAQAKFPSRLRMLDSSGNLTTNVSQAAMFERTFPTGAAIRYSASTGYVEVLTTPGGREVTRESRGVEVIRRSMDGVDAIRQIRGSRAFVDIRVDPNDLYGYEIHLFAPENAGSKNGSTGLYEPTGTAHTIWRIENPNQSDTNLDEILVTKTSGAKSWLYHFEYSPSAEDWSLAYGDPQDEYRVDRKTAFSDAGWPGTLGARRTVIQEVYDGEPGVGRLLSKEAKTSEIFGWGEAVIEIANDPDGLNLATEYTYYTSPAEEGRYGRLQSVQYPDGRWVVHDYDGFGRKTQEKRGWLDAPFDAEANEARVIFYSYAAVDPADVDYGLTPATENDLTADARRPRQVVETILGQEVGRTYHAYRDESGERVEITERAASPGAAFGASGNERTTRRYYSDSVSPAERGRLKSVRYPDGREEFYTYSISGGNLTISVEERFADGGGNHVPVANLSMRTDTVLDHRGLEVERKVLVFTGGGFDSAPVEHTVFAYNEYGELSGQKRVDGANEFVLYESVWANGEKVSEIDRFGVTTAFMYNAIEQVQTSTKTGISGSGNYAAQPDIVTVYERSSSSCGCGSADSQSITVDGVTLHRSHEHDMADRHLSDTDENGFTTEFSYADGGRIVTRTLPSGATEIPEHYLDGQVKSITGTAVVARYFTYGTDSGGNRYTHTSIGAVDSARWEQTTVNMLGRMVETEKPAFGGGSHLTQYEYDDQGRMTRLSQPGKADTLFEYDVVGNLYRTGFKTDGAGTELIPASTDRITETVTSYTKEGGDWFRIQATSVYATDHSATATKIGTVKERFSSFGASVFSQTYRYDAHGNETVETVTVDRSAKLVTFQTDVPGSNIPAKRIVRNGLLQAENPSTLAAATTYVYDGFGRRIESVDPRIGATKTTYREFNSDGVTYTGNLVAVTEDPAGNITTFHYHESGSGTGQISVREDSDGKKTFFSYNARGQQVRTWGATYPVEYEYDADFGHLIAQHTFRGGSGWFAPTWPTNPGAKDTTTWHYAEATGLLEAKEYADQTQTQYSYHPSGELATRTWARLINGQPLVTTYTYWEDNGGELKKVAYNDSTPDVEYSYTRTGQMETVTDAVGTRTFDYTDHLELETEVVDGTGSGLYSLVITRKYEGTGSGEVAGRASGVAVGDHLNPSADYDGTWHYDSFGRFSRVQGPGLPSYGAEYGYVPNGRRVETVSYKTNSFTTVASSTYSPLANRNHVETVENVAGTGTISRYHYAYNEAGLRMSVENSGTAFTSSTHNLFDYNDRGEVIKSERFGGTLSVPGAEIVNERREYLFDVIGNRLSHIDGVDGLVAYTTNALNQYTAVDARSPIHDADGNLIHDGHATYHWDSENRLIFVETIEENSASFSYDYKGRRIRSVFEIQSEIVEERYVWDEWNLLLILDENNELIRKFSWGLDIAEQANGLGEGYRPGAAAGGVGGLLAVEEVSGDRTDEYVYFYDVNGNVGQVFDWDSGAISAHYEYDSFGRTIISFGYYVDLNRFRFSTKIQDQVTALYYYGYRFYDPELGRWISKDPIEERGGLSLYGFIGNNAIIKSDYLGLTYQPPKWESPPPSFPPPPPPPGECPNKEDCLDDCQYDANTCLMAVSVACAPVFLFPPPLGGMLCLATGYSGCAVQKARCQARCNQKHDGDENSCKCQG